MISPSDHLLLRVENLKTYFYTADGVVPAVDGVSFQIKSGQTLGIVGESGCGKSVTAFSILRLIPQPPGKIVAGHIWLGGRDLLALSEEELRKIRGNDISMIFQEPMTSLNPVFTVGEQIAEVIRLHQDLGRKEAWKKAVDMLAQVGIPSPRKQAKNYPHQMSGGMRQRVMIAIAISCNPRLLIADEPTTALDVTIQAQILDLLRKLQQEMGMAIILITHDLGVIAEMAHWVTVMYAGQIVESASVRELFKTPQHPYTIGLLASVPKLTAELDRLVPIEGVVPEPLQFPPGCRFAPRCPLYVDACSQAVPPFEEVVSRHWTRCIRWQEVPSLRQNPLLASTH